MKVLVVGDICLDNYIIGTVGGMSADAPVPVLKQTADLAFPGMGANVVVMLQQLGVDAQLLLPSVNPHTGVKNRAITPEGQQLLRWDVEDWCSPITPEDVQTALIDQQPDILVVSDYNKGAVGEELIGYLLGLGDLGMPLYVDSKKDPFLWIGSHVTLFPNQYEYAQYKAHYDWMPSVVLKRSAEGAQILNWGNVAMSSAVHPGPVRNVCGAGDAFLAGWVASRGGSLYDCLKGALRIAANYVSHPFTERIVTHARIHEGIDVAATGSVGGPGLV